MTAAVTSVSRRDGVAIVSLRRPAAGNRITTQMAREVAAALDALREDEKTVACVLTGEGDAFCLGGDFHGEGATAAGRAAYAQALVAMDRAMCRLGKPLVAAVNGDAHAGGFGLVVACDLAVVAGHATLGLPEAARGFFPFIATAAVRDALPKKVFFDLAYRARMMDAREAQALGLVNEIVAREAVLDRAVAVAAAAGGHDAGIVRLGRDLYYDLRGLPPEAAFERASGALAEALEAYAAVRRGRMD